MIVERQSWIAAFAGMTKARGVKIWGFLPIFILFALPLTISLFYAMIGAFDSQAWQALFTHPQLWLGLELTIFTGATATGLALVTAIIIVAATYETASWTNLPTAMGAMLALPHLALAIGLGFLIMPSGVLARIIGNTIGWQTPPNWITTHDPYGLALIAALTIKETPFLIWFMAGLLTRDDIKQDFKNQHAAALSLGHGCVSIWLRLYLPQMLPKLIWPLVIVFIYAATVVDMSLVIGPTQPPTLATVVWADINSEQVINNARGNVGAVFLSLALAFCLFVAYAILKSAAPLYRKFLSVGPSSQPLPNVIGGANYQILSWLYVIVTALLLFMSFAQLWPFPNIIPTTSTRAWDLIFHNPNALITSAGLAIATSATALILIILWLENLSKKTDQILVLLSLAILGLPAILVGLGQYRAFLNFGLTGNLIGLYLAHLMPVTAYMIIVLVGPYRAIDPRYNETASSFAKSKFEFLKQIKLPLLKAPIFAALAVGFAVSFGQYIPAQLIAAGRYSTLPIEAVTLTSGTNRPLTAAFALLLLLPPLLAYVIAAQLGKSRWTRP
jgi:putative thiamine transport system permease protein